MTFFWTCDVMENRLHVSSHLHWLLWEFSSAFSSIITLFPHFQLPNEGLQQLSWELLAFADIFFFSRSEWWTMVLAREYHAGDPPFDDEISQPLTLLFSLFDRDVLSLALPALHIAPFFLYNNVYNPIGNNNLSTNGTTVNIFHNCWKF